MSNIFDSMLPDEPNDPSPNDDASSIDNDNGTLFDSTPSTAVKTSRATPLDVKEATQELLRHGHVDESSKSGFFQKVVIHSAAINVALEPLDLTLQLDEHRGVAFLKVRKDDSTDLGQEWTHPLVRRQRLTLEQSMMVAILRQTLIAHEQETGVGECEARVAIEDLLPQFLTYFEDSGSDAKNESRLSNVLDQLKTHGIISEVDSRQEITIRPLIAHLADPAALNSLLQALQEKAEPDSLNDSSELQEPYDEQ